jgi:hypothetical protein
MISSTSTSLPSLPSSTTLSTILSTSHLTSIEPIVSLHSTTTQPLLTSSPVSATTRIAKLITKPQSNWVMSEWSQCSVSCGNGTQVRTAICASDTGIPCNSGQKPEPEVRYCNRLCSLFQWKWFPWSECSATCGKGFKSRLIQCLDWTNSVVPNQFCDPSTKPKNIRRCKKHACPFVWQTSHWSQV